jgi:uncharacterized membrane protein
MQENTDKTLKIFDYKKFIEWKKSKFTQSQKNEVDILDYVQEFTELITTMKKDLLNYKGSEENKLRLQQKFEKINYCYHFFLKSFSFYSQKNNELEIYIQTTNEIISENIQLKSELQKIQKEITNLKKNIYE